MCVRPHLFPITVLRLFRSKDCFKAGHKPNDFNSMEIILQLYMLGDVIMKFEGGSFSIRIIFRHICEHLTLNGVSFYHSD